MRRFSKNRQTGYRHRAQAAPTSHPRQYHQQQQEEEFHATGIDSGSGTGIARPNKRAAGGAASTLEAPPPAKRVRMVAPSSSSPSPSDVSPMSAPGTQGGGLAAAAVAAAAVRFKSGYGPMMIARPPRVLIAVDDVQRNRNVDGTLGSQSQDLSRPQSHLLPIPPQSLDVSKGSEEGNGKEKRKEKEAVTAHTPSTGSSTSSTTTTKPSNATTSHPQPPPSQQNPPPNQATKPKTRIRTREPFSHQSASGRQQPLSLAHYMGYDHNINLAQYAPHTLVGTASGGEPAIATTSATDVDISGDSQAQTQRPLPAYVADDDDDEFMFGAMDIDDDDNDELGSIGLYDNEQHKEQPQYPIAQGAQQDAPIATLQTQLEDATVVASKNKGIHHRSHRTRPRPRSHSSSSDDPLLLSGPFASPSLRISKNKYKRSKNKKNKTKNNKTQRLTKSGVPCRRRRTQIELVMDAAIRAGFVEQVPNRSLVTGEPLVEEPLERFERNWRKREQDVWEEELEGEDGEGEGHGEEEGGVKSIGQLLKDMGIGAKGGGVGDGEDKGGAWDGDDEDELYD